ncbi:TPA: hypothetical protein N0F65_002349 [Lagenidium giganteum]|uniref:Uncharacterized protein n=1 Tax=Lagenidium giganteum TaxID=4803 RepID=A0AAV2Z735_9STRA|nr:TPA: hypothetical protein N0F65_002349 [Lagenidium giganteum]
MRRKSTGERWDRSAPGTVASAGTVRPGYTTTMLPFAVMRSNSSASQSQAQSVQLQPSSMSQSTHSQIGYFHQQSPMSSPRHGGGGADSFGALTPSHGSKSQPGSPQSSMEEALRAAFEYIVPTIMDCIAKYQYQRALTSFAPDQRPTKAADWKHWDAFVVAMKLLASCESTYHMLKYLDAENVQSDTIDKMYNKLSILLNHLAEELKPIASRHHHLASNAAATSTSASVHLSGRALSAEDIAAMVMGGDIPYFFGFFDQAADFFALRIGMIEVYRDLALKPLPYDLPRVSRLKLRPPLRKMMRDLDDLLSQFTTFDHPLLDVLKQSALEEIRTVKAALLSEQRIAEYNFTQAIIALHKLKMCLRVWGEQIDSLSEYPLFDESDDDDYFLSDSNYSSAASSSATFSNGMPINNGPTNYNNLPPAPAYSRSVTTPSRCKSLSNVSDMPPGERADETTSRKQPNAKPDNSAGGTSAGVELPLKLSRLLSQNSLLKRGMSISSISVPRASNLRYLIGFPRGAGENESNASVEQTILGGVGAASGVSNDSAVATNPSVISNERDEGYALPLFQWSRRFYRSLVAKFTLYFHKWLEPLEKKGDVVFHDLTRYIRSPVGISYLQLMDVLIARGSYRGDDSKAYIMLVLETDQLPGKSAHYYANGYMCPGSSNAKRAAVPLKSSSAQQQQGTKGTRKSPGTGSRSSGPGVSGNSNANKASGLSTSPGAPQHGLFMKLDLEGEEDQADFAPLWGLRSWPAIFCYPHSEPPIQHWPNLISLIMDNRQAIQASHPVLIFVWWCKYLMGSFSHVERRMKTAYYITQIDRAVSLVLVLEGKRRPSEKVTLDFMQTLTDNLQHTSVFGRRRILSGAATAS